MPRRAPQATIAKYLIAFKWPALQVSNGLKVLVIGQNVMLKGPDELVTNSQLSAALHGGDSLPDVV